MVINLNSVLRYHCEPNSSDYDTKKINSPEHLNVFESFNMPTVYRPILLHILCDDLEYEKKIFGNLDHQYSHVSQSSTKTKQTALNESNVTSSCFSIDATHYSILRLIILGNYKA